MGDAFTTFVLPLLGVLFVILLAYLGTGWLAKKYTGASAGGGRYMRVIDRLSLGQDKALLLVKTGGKIQLIGVSAKGFDVLRELNENELPEAQEADQPKYDFSSVLASAMKKSPLMDKLKNKRGGKGDGK